MKKTQSFKTNGKLVWMDFEMKTDEGKVMSAGGYNIANCFTPEFAEDIARGLNDLEKTKRMKTVLEKLVDSLPELNDEDTPLEGSQAVDVLCGLWDEIKEALK